MTIIMERIREFISVISIFERGASRVTKEWGTWWGTWWGRGGEGVGKGWGGVAHHNLKYL